MEEIRVLANRSQRRHVNDNPEMVAIIVEPRNHVHLLPAVHAMMCSLGPSAALKIYHGRRNIALAQEVATREAGTCELLETDDMTIEQYNELLTSEEFWETVPNERVVIFQCDVLALGRALPSGLDRWAYVGAPWSSRHPVARSEVGNGGLSYRSRSAMLTICSRHRRTVDVPEDVFFAGCLAMENSNDHVIAPKDVARRFSVENVWYDEPFGLHKSYATLSPYQLHALLAGAEPLTVHYRCDAIELNSWIDVVEMIEIESIPAIAQIPDIAVPSKALSLDEIVKEIIVQVLAEVGYEKLKYDPVV
jgi:hypothetical protein